MSTNKLSKEQRECIVQRYLEGESGISLSREFKVADVNVYNLLKYRNIPRRTQEELRDYHVDHRYFETVDSDEKAYWLGFIYADGGVVNNTLKIELSAIDKEHIHLFGKSIKSNHPLVYRESQNSWALQVHSSQMIRDLRCLGVHPCKSRTIKFPFSIDDNFMPGFCRGFWDGDGWITSKRYGINKDCRVWSVGFASMSVEFLDSLRSWLRNRINRNIGSLIERKGGCGQLTFEGNPSVRSIIEAMYAGQTISLVRKRILCESVPGVKIN